MFPAIKRCKVFGIGCIIALLLGACEGSFTSSVPRYPVYFTIDTRQGVYVHFTPEALNTYVIVNRQGYYYNGHTYPLLATDAYGYGGVVVFIDIMGNYGAYDLACPHCAGRGLKKSCEIDGIFAVCPECGEQYDLGSGTAAPQKGIAREALLRINVTNSGGKLTVRQ